MISIVIPTYDRPAALARCLDGVAAMTGVPEDLEVIVVNDGGTPVTALIERPCGQLDLTVVAQSHGGPAAARNAGLACARRPFVAFLDDDCVPGTGWIAALAARFAAVPDAAVGGRTLNALPANPFSTASQLLMDYLYAHHNGDDGRVRFLASNNLAFPRDALRAIGGFDASFPRAAGEDRELCDRWRHCGHRMTFAPEAVVHHAHPLGPRTFWRQHFDYGRGACAFRRARLRRDGGRVSFESARFYANLVRAPFARTASARAARPHRPARARTARERGRLRVGADATMTHDAADRADRRRRPIRSRTASSGLRSPGCWSGTRALRDLRSGWAGCRGSAR